MKNLLYIIIGILCLSGCGKTGPGATITGEIDGLDSTYIHVYGADELSDIVDTIRITENKISHIFPADTLLQVMLVMDNKTEYPLYLDKNSKITIKGNMEDGYLDIKGVKPNEELTAFYKSIEPIRDIPDSVTNAAKQFIRLNQTSLVSIYLLDKYFVQQAEPDFSLIRQLITNMDGTLQDKPYIERISNLLEDAEKVEVGKTALSFTVTNSKGESITRTKFRNKYLLINFWASWCDSCKVSNSELRQIYKTHHKKENFAMLGISLDLDKTQWLETIKADTLEWEQACDFMGLENAVAKQYGVYSIPYNILLGTDGKVINRNIHGDELTDKLKELLKEEEKDKKKKR